jgi:hypothetical protein
MKKFILLSLFLFSITFASQGQISFDTNYHENPRVDVNDFDYRYTYLLYNDTLDLADTNFVWELTYVDMPDEWEYIVGFNNYCGFFPPEKTGSLIIPSNTIENVRMYFTMWETPGSGTLHLSITSVLNPSNRDTIVFKINCRSLVSVDSQEALEGNIFPNPASDYITIQTVPGANYTLTNIQGQVVKEGKLSDTTSSIDVTDIQSGSYFIRLSNNGKVRTEKVMVE